MLHIVNGDSTAGILKQSDVKGECLSWRETLVEGPAPQGLSDEDWHTLRAGFLADAYELELKECERELAAQHEALLRFSDHEEVVLWFEHDLFCQINMVYLLSWFSRQPLSNTRLSLICIGEFPGIANFRGLGELTPDQLGGLFAGRREVTDSQLKLAAEVWQAYSSPDPRGIQSLLGRDTSALPFLSGALEKHLARFPSVANGLGLVENRAIELVSRGFTKFGQLFCEFGNLEPAYGLGDSQFWNGLKRMIQVREPLLELRNLAEVDQALKTNEFIHASFAITEKGEAVLASADNFIASSGIDLWLGGVHLRDTDDLWQWDGRTRSLVYNKIPSV